MTQTVTRRLTPKQYRIVQFCEQFFLEHGHLPVAGDVVSVGHLKQDFMDLLRNQTFNQILEQRGITPYVSLNDQGKVSAQLTDEQLMTANIMLDLHDPRSQVKKLKECEVSSQTWQAWLREPAFRNYLKKRSEALLGDNTHEAHFALIQRVRSGDVSALKFYYEITGRYAPANTKALDVQSILFQVLEIIQQEVPDVATQARIARKMMGLAEPTASIFDDEPVVRQEIVEVANGTFTQPALASAPNPTIVDLPKVFDFGSDEPSESGF